MNQFALPTPFGELKVCHLWDFLKEVRVYMVPAVAETLASRRVELYKESFKFYSNNDPQIQFAYAETEHLLKLNPSQVLVELKKTTTPIERRGKKVFLEPLVHDLVRKSMEDFGKLSHMFPVGQNRYALVDSEDIRLVIDKNYRQTLVCVNPKRNFTLYAPNLKVVAP
jgi:hypothetical protein